LFVLGPPPNDFFVSRGFSRICPWACASIRMIPNSRVRYDTFQPLLASPFLLYLLLLVALVGVRDVSVPEYRRYQIYGRRLD
jgi:hypothetical protein